MSRSGCSMRFEKVLLLRCALVLSSMLGSALLSVPRAMGQAADPVSMLAPYVLIKGDFSSGSQQRLGAAGLVTGDFNRDGQDDVAVVWRTTSDSTLLLFLSNGDGTFRSGSAVVSGVGGLIVADFNADGKLDLATFSDKGLLVFLGKGNGTFEPGILNAQIPQTSRFVGAADYNLDGNLDLIFDDQMGNSSLFPGTGKGTFGNVLAIAVRPSLVGDVNGDKIPDIIGFFEQPQSVGRPGSVLLGNGDGTFRAAITLPAECTKPVVLADFNDDGKPDLVCSVGSANLTGFPAIYSDKQILLGNGDGTFQAAANVLGIGAPTFAADFNHDGKLDLFDGFGILPGNGDGTFNKPVTLYTPPYGCATPIQCTGGIVYASAADLNGDGLPDVVYAFASGNFGDPPQVLAFLNAGKGDGILQSAVSSPTGSGTPAQFSIVSLYGIDLASYTATASGPSFPIELGGVRVHIGEQLATLFYVSPTQINYVLPRHPLDTGLLYNPMISIEHVGQPFVQKGISVPFVLDAPELFISNPSGLAAATAVRIAPDGTQTSVAVQNCSQGLCYPVPIDTAGDPVYLSLYGTGFNSISDPATNPSGSSLLRCGSVGQIVYAGPQGQIPGLEQINIQLSVSPTPGTAINRPITCTELKPATVDPYRTSYTSNPVYITVK